MSLPRRRLRFPCLAAWTLALVPGVAGAQGDPFHEAWRWAHYTTEAGLPSDRVLALVEASDGTPWVHTIRGLAWYDDFRWVQVEHSQTLPFGTQSGLQPDLDGGVLLVGYGELFRANRSGLSFL